MSGNECVIAAEVIESRTGLILEVSDTAKRELVNAIRRWEKPGPVTIRVRQGKEPKSAPQLRKIHAMFREIAQETGNKEDIVKAELKQKFLTRREDFTDMETGEMTTRTIVPSLADLDLEEMKQFISEVELWAGEWLGMTFERAGA